MTQNIPEIYGSLVFNDRIMRSKLPKDMYKALKKTIENGTHLELDVANSVAVAMKEWAIENSLYIYYASPNKLVREDAEYKKKLGDDYYNYLYSYPASYLNEDGTLNTKKVQYYYDLDRDTKDLLATLWDRLKAAN